MIVAFRSREAQRVWRGHFNWVLPLDIQQTALRKLRLSNNAKALTDLAVQPNNRLEGLKGDRSGQLGIRVNQQRRICCVSTAGGPNHVEIVDYHWRNPESNTGRNPVAGIH